jgi:hypothetical protein
VPVPEPISSRARSRRCRDATAIPARDAPCRERTAAARRERVAAAVGEGSMAIAFIHQYLREALL